MKEWDLDPANKTPTTDGQEIIDNLKEMLGPERKIFTEMRSVLTQNLAKMFGLKLGQYTPRLH